VSHEALSRGKTPALEIRFCTGEVGGAHRVGEWIGVSIHAWAELIEQHGDHHAFLVEERTVINQKSISIRLDWLRGLAAKAAEHEQAAAFGLQFVQDGKPSRGFDHWVFVEKHRWQELTEISGDGEAPRASGPCRSRPTPAKSRRRQQ